MLPMRVRVLFFGILKDLTGLSVDEAEFAAGTRLTDVFARYGKRHPRLAEFQSSVAASINQEYAQWDSPLKPGDEVAFLPPVSGGQGAPASMEADPLAGDSLDLVRSVIPGTTLIERVKDPANGAVAVFDGIVRNFSRVRNSSGDWEHRKTLYLEYEAYEPMALSKMREIGREMHQRFAIHRIAMVHRLGRLEIGETSVFIAVSAPHRAAALDACRFAIDTLKQIVPIWKKEYFADGAVWAEGERPTANPPSDFPNPTSQ
jgi:molybdopterin synthase catalytic subunit